MNLSSDLFQFYFFIFWKFVYVNHGLVAQMNFDTASILGEENQCKYVIASAQRSAGRDHLQHAT
jgi:hypothetical protein